MPTACWACWRRSGSARLAREELSALGRVIAAYGAYGDATRNEVARWEVALASLREEEQALVPRVAGRCKRARELVAANEAVLREALGFFDGGAEMLAAAEASGGRVPMDDVEKVRCVLRSLARDWSDEGAAEREACYAPLLEEMRRVLPLPSLQHAGAVGGAADGAAESQPPRVLVPGAGLGRLAWEAAVAGYDAQGNEFSYYMMLASNFVLNSTSDLLQRAIYPWVHQSSNNVSDVDAQRPARFPDVCPSVAAEGGGPLRMSMCAGDFVEVYTQDDMHGAFDCVLSCFFLDTAENVLQYLRAIHTALRPGGYLINLGPLLYHWAEHGGAHLSLELSLEDVIAAAEGIGFEMLRREEELRPCGYTGNARSMQRTVYHCAMFTLRKRPV